MQRDYLHVKENQYRQGVLQGNYVEELYADDFKQNQTINSYYPMSETKSQFKYQGFEPNNSKNTLKEKVDSKNKRMNLNSLKKEEEEEEKEEKDIENIVKVEKVGCEENKENKENNLKNILGLGKSLKMTYEMLSREGSLEEEEIPFKKNKLGDDYRFKTSYNLSYDLHIKPQVFTKNDWRGDLSTLKTIKIEEKNIKERLKKTLEMKTIKEKAEKDTDFSKKNLGFSKTFDVPEILIGWRN